MKGLIFQLLACVLATVNLHGQEVFQDKIENLPGTKGMYGASYGISVIDLSGGKIIDGINENKAMVPASVMKIITSATALETLGENYVFETILGYTGKIEKESGMLMGDLVVAGGGDPSLGSGYFKDFYNDSDFIDRWVNEVIRSGISGIEGNLVVDATIYDDEEIPGTWVWEDIGNYYGAGASGIVVYDNLFSIVFRSGPAGEITKIKQTLPEIPGLEIENEVRASKVNRDNAYVYGSPWGGKRIVRGTIPENRNEFIIKASLPLPAKFLGERFKGKLAGKGIKLEGKVLMQKVKRLTGFSVIYIQRSPELSEIVKVLNHESVNLFAEQLLKHLSYIHKGPGSVSDGTDFIKKYWKEKGLDTSGMFIEDGSGLSHFNLLSAGQLTWILNYMKTKSPVSESFLESLPVAGKGTLTVFSTTDFPGDCLKAKSGSMTRVRSYAGYLKARSGKELAFAFIFNNFSMTQAELTRVIGNLLNALRGEY